MQAGFKFVAEHHMDRALDLEPAQSVEGFGLDGDVEMGLSARRGTRMAGMARGIVCHFEANRGKRLFEFFTNPYRSACQFWSPRIAPLI